MKSLKFVLIPEGMSPSLLTSSSKNLKDKLLPLTFKIVIFFFYFVILFMLTYYAQLTPGKPILLDNLLRSVLWLPCLFPDSVLSRALP